MESQHIGFIYLQMREEQSTVVSSEIIAGKKWLTCGKNFYFDMRVSG